MTECLINVLNARNTVLHVFPIPVGDQGNAAEAVDPEQEALQLAAAMQLVPEAEMADLRARPHVCRGGPLTPYGDVLETRRQMQERTEQRIRERAYYMWRHEGCPEGRADEHWHRAREIEADNGPN